MRAKKQSQKIKNKRRKATYQEEKNIRESHLIDVKTIKNENEEKRGRMRNLRSNTHYRHEENENTKLRLRMMREKEEFRSKENVSTRRRVSKLREDENFKKVDIIRTRKRLAKLRELENFKKGENARTRQRLAKLREDEGLKRVENARTRQRLSKLREDELFKKVDNIRTRQRLAKLREDEGWKKKETAGTRQRVSKLRENENFKKIDNIRTRQRLAKLREIENFKEVENARTRTRLSKLREDELYKKADNIRTRERLAKLREGEDFKELENAGTCQRVAKLRKDEIYKKDEIIKTQQRIRKLRQNSNFHLKENRSNLYRMRRLRLRDKYVIKKRKRNIARIRVCRQKLKRLRNEIANEEKINTLLQTRAEEDLERAENALRIRKLRRRCDFLQKVIKNNLRRDKLKIGTYKVRENTKNLRRMRLVRNRQNYKLKENFKNKQNMKKKRISNINYRRREMHKDAKLREESRFNEFLYIRNILYNNLIKKQKADPFSKLKMQFIQFRAETPSYICCCCEGIFFKHSVVKLNKTKIINKSGADFFLKINNFPSDFICNTCKNFAYIGKVYRLSTSNGLKFITIPKAVTELNDLEERMVAPVLNFMQIRSLKPYALNPQLGLKGSVVNIIIDVNDMLQLLPRNFNNMQTIQVKLKRHILHKSHYMFEAIRPGTVCGALKYLIETPLYKKYGIKVDAKYISHYENMNLHEEINFIVDDKDLVDVKSKSLKDKIERDDKNQKNESSLIDMHQINNDEVLLVDNNTNITGGRGPVVNVIAPGQNKRPIAWHNTEDLDELCFPKIFAGHPMNLPKNISYADRIKSEVRRYDRRSCIPSRVLFMAKKNLEKTCLSSINICLRKTTKNMNMNLKAEDVLNPEKMNEIIKFDDGYRMFKYIRSSPAFWEQKKKELLAMIRQLGKPTFFLTLSAGESYWPELLQTLAKYSVEGCVKGRVLNLKEAYELDNNTKTTLIRNDPVSCARYFDYKVRKFMWLLKQQSSIFGKYALMESYERVEFQQRGSPHEHILLWLKDAPKFEVFCNAGDNEALVHFIDNFLTCENDENNPYVKFQKHKHSHACYKGKRDKKCRFHIPYPVMETTMILEPLGEDEVAPRSYRVIDELMRKFSDTNKLVLYEEILKELNMNEQEYILAVRSTLKQRRVFLKRTSAEVNINAYNKDILQLFESNIDLQFILDEYAVISYVTNYISKVDGGLSKLLREAAADCDINHKSIKDKLRTLANVFLNSNLMSAQEAAYHVLSMSLSKKSRKTIFINTSPIEERVVMLKSENALKPLKNDSTEIYVVDIFEKYSNRQASLDRICLAEYAANYDIKNNAKKSNDDDENEDIDIDDDKYKNIHNACKRKITAIIRYRRYKLKQDPANYYREQILLYKPWRIEKLEVEDVDYETVYNNNKQIITRNQGMFSIICDEAIDEALEEVEKDNNSNNRENSSDKYNDDKLSDNQCIDIFQQGDSKKVNQNKVGALVKKTRYSIPPRVPEIELWNMLNDLNSKQKEFVLHILNCFKTGKSPFKIFLGGSAGVGKSTVIKSLYQLITNYFDKLPGGNNDKIVVLLCAPSGKAAFLINGVTLHSAFALPCHRFGVNLPQLSNDLANNIREKLSKVQLLIIDEISMVGSTVFSQINTRLRQITGINEPFGGISVLAVGDLNQLPPVRDKPVYHVSGQNELAQFLDINPLWDQFDFYELTEIMRQKDGVLFTRALNNLAIGTMTDEDLKLIKSREVKNEKNVPETAIRLYATNVNVSSYNAKRISQCKSKLFTSKAEVVFSKEISEQEKKMVVRSMKSSVVQALIELPDVIELKVDIKYMVTNNIDIEDGLVNGACGILKYIECKNEDVPSILWLDFYIPRVGLKARTRYIDYMTKNNIDHALTPIERIVIQTNIVDDEKYMVYKNQFPVRPAEAITIHKSQGQTYDSICLDFTKRENRSLSMLYVALSRVTKLSGLFILGALKVPNKSKESNIFNSALSELERLRTIKQLKLSYNNFENVIGTKIVYQNIGTLKSKLMYIIKDKWYLQADILILSETLTSHEDQLDIENFHIALRIDYSNHNRGLICYVKNNMHTVLMSSEHSSLEKGYVQVFALQIQNFYLISGYKSPQATKIMFETVISKTMQKLNSNSTIIFIGDFNYNIINHVNKANTYLVDFLKKYQLTPTLPSNSITTTLHTQIDVIFSNSSKVECGVHETYFSYHKPIYAIYGNFNTTNNQYNTENDINRKIISDDHKNIHSGHNINKDFLMRKDNVSNKIIDKNKAIDIHKNNELPECLTDKNDNDGVATDPYFIINYEQNMNSNIHVNDTYDINDAVECYNEPYDFEISVDECKEVSHPNMYLNDKHINLFHEIMNRTLNSHGIFSCAQNTGYMRAFLSNLQAIPRGNSNIQIIYSGGLGTNVIGHWICTRYDGNGSVHIYDSLNKNRLENDQIDFLNALYRFEKKYIFHKVQSQNNGIDCGAFAIYFATLLCFDEPPEERELYQVPIMRNHIVKMLLDKKLHAFPNC